MRFDSDPLDHPPWHALTTAHAGFAIGDGLARRYKPAFAPMAAVRDVSDASLAALHNLMRPGDVVGLFGPEPVSPGTGLDAVALKTVEQMVYRHGDAPPPAEVAVPLGEGDVPAMMELVALTNPGPFSTRTVALGAYVGIRRGEKLIAMAGERMKFNGFTEISAVCTHPEHRGKGHACALVLTLMRDILRLGATPFLHVFSDNKAAAALYRELGFMHRRSLAVTILQRPEQRDAERLKVRRRD